MTIFINGEARNIDSPQSVDSLLDVLSLPRQRIAIELNRKVIRKKDWENTFVNADDKVEIVHFVGGG